MVSLNVATESIRWGVWTLAPDLHTCVLGVQSLKASGSAFNAIPLSAIHTNTLQPMSQEKKKKTEEEKFENNKNKKGTGLDNLSS